MLSCPGGHFLSRGVTDTDLNLVGNLPSLKNKLARHAMISENVSDTANRREVGTVSMRDDLGGAE